jgi:hypothetical protein
MPPVRLSKICISRDTGTASWGIFAVTADFRVFNLGRSMEVESRVINYLKFHAGEVDKYGKKLTDVCAAPRVQTKIKIKLVNY